MSPPLSRRSLLTGSGAVALTALAGCSAISDVLNDESYAGLESVTVENRSTSQQAVTVEVESAGELITDETVDMSPQEESSDSVLLQCRWTDSTGPYVVHAQHEESGESETVRLDENHDSPQQVEIIVAVNPSSEARRLSVYDVMNQIEENCSGDETT
ncbi:hypothetical protein [Halomarina litorea]|uniref:hypothetical protein n=1 Tax=Halomarina litorea TaxID=2961595 RepID=UPI0020C2DAD2|nr:hypothetical protein [Halomarina sp. BCD28]